ncbi:MAG TPA: hypothetical protein VF180_02415, partial [Acidimicrobiia bacterium]
KSWSPSSGDGPVMRCVAVSDGSAARDEARRLASRIGGLIKASRYSPEELTGAARRGFRAGSRRKSTRRVS